MTHGTGRKRDAREIPRRPGRRRAAPFVAFAQLLAGLAAVPPLPAPAAAAGGPGDSEAAPASSGVPADFVRMTAHWDDYAHPDYIPFLRDAAVEVAQVGFYGAHFWSLVHTPEFGGYPAHFPVRGLDEAAAWFRQLNARLHEMGIVVVGHFNVEFLVGDPDGPEGPRGFFHWYRELWDEAVLGPKPVEDPLELLERGADGAPLVNRSYAIGGMNEYWACLRNPAWQSVLEAWVGRAVDLGVDGLIANYFYRHDCTCRHCDDAFREYLAERFTTETLRDRFGIADLGTHRFGEIVSWHDPGSSTPLRREMLRFSQVSNKQVFDEVFVRFGRSLKPDLLVAQWNHLGDFAAISGDERCLLPGDLWARDESYLWYSTGGSANFTDLENGFFGDAVLQARFIRGAADDKPFVLGKYEATRIRAAIAELAANGGAPMGFYTRFTDPGARREIVRYYRFLERFDGLFRGNRSHAEAILPFPRTRVHQGDLEPLAAFRAAGRALLDRHVLFDVVPDDELDRASDGAVDPRVVLDVNDPRVPDGLSRFEAPFTVRVSASRPAGPRGDHEIDLHFVNYDREEPPRSADGRPSPGSGIGDEKPIASEGVGVDLRLPEGIDTSAVRVSFATPESPEPVAVEPAIDGDRLCFTTPGFLVYGVARIRLRDDD